MTHAADTVRVMQSFRAPRSTTNPYITMLDESLSKCDEVEHLRFSWGAALFGQYDVFHWHWPEGKLHGATWWKSAGKYALTAMIALRHQLSRKIAVVRTIHNVELPDDNGARRWLLRRVHRQTAHSIVLNETTELPETMPRTLILHGHYSDWYEARHHATRVRGQLGTFGGVRRYKSVNALVDAYAGAVEREPELSLRIGGRPSSAELADDLRQRTESLPGIQLQLEFLTDEELVELATSSELIVLAYSFMHNSGSVLAALSLGRPVLVPRNPPNMALADEVGTPWVLMYDGDLDAETLVRSWRSAATLTDDDRPDLSRRDWLDAGQLHAAAYRAAVSDAREGRSST